MLGDFIAALRFLTVIPFGGTYQVRVRGTQEEEKAEGAAVTDVGSVARSLNYYSLIGLGLGGILALSAWGISFTPLSLSGDVLLIALLVILTGGLHLDGLADTADGVFNCRTREQKLDIMRDSNIGAMGAVALVLVLMLKVALTGDLGLVEKLKYLFLMPAVGRGAMVWSVVMFPYARKSGGLGTSLQEAGAAVLLSNGVVLVLAGLVLVGWAWLLMLLVVLGFVHGLGLLLSKHLGGLTGDTYGAICELTEISTLLLGVIF